MEKEPKGLSLPRPEGEKPEFQEGREETAYLMEARNGMEVWVPESRLDAWEAAQSGAKKPLTPAQQQLKDRLLERLSGGSR